VGDAALVWRGLATLPPRRRVVLVLHADEGLDDEAIGARLGLAAAGVRSEREAGMAALRSILLRRGRPEELLPAALAEVADAGSEPPAASAPPVPRRRGRRRLVVAGAAAAALAAAAAVLVPALGGGVEADRLPAATAPAGGLDWPARGPLAGDRDLLRAALRAWRDGVPADQRPVDPAALYAGRPDGARVVLLQGADQTGLISVAEVTEAGGPLALRRVEPLGRAVPLLALPAAGAVGGAGTDRTVRLLTPPDGAVGAGGVLLVRDPGLAPAAPLRRLAVGADGLSEPLDPGHAGVPVVLLGGDPSGRPASDGPPAVAGSGLVTAGRLTVTTGTVEIGAGSLPLAGSADVRSLWYDDGALVAARLGGPVVVAAAGPVLAAAVRSAGSPARPRRLEARSYEAQRSGARFLATVFRLDGAPACVETTPLGPAGGPPALPVQARRCVPAGVRDGAVHVVAGEQVAEVRLRVPTRGKAGRARTLTVRRPAGQPAGTGFLALVPVADLPARGGGGAAYAAGGQVVARITLGPAGGPRG